MKKVILGISLLLFLVAQKALASIISSSVSEINTSGAFGFPQKTAKIIYLDNNLKFSVWNNNKYIFAQAILFQDFDTSFVEGSKDKKLHCDYSAIAFDLNNDKKRSAYIDKDYYINPWPDKPGLYFQICLSDNSWTGLNYSDKEKGSIDYVKTDDGKIFRIDTFLISLEEISIKPGDKIGICFNGISPKPKININSANFYQKNNVTYPNQIPLDLYYEYTLIEGHEIDISKIPNSEQKTLIQKSTKLFDFSPEISAKEWINYKGIPSLKDLQGKIVLFEFWATWCGPCRANIPHMNAIFEKSKDINLQVLSFTDENRKTVDEFLKENQIYYPIGIESSMNKTFNIRGIPFAVLIDKTGKIVWKGHPASEEMENTIEFLINDGK